MREIKKKEEETRLECAWLALAKALQRRARILDFPKLLSFSKTAGNRVLRTNFDKLKI